VSDPGLEAAVAAGILADEATHRQMLRSIVDVARAIFGARAASVFLLDEATDELVFEAVSGEGEDSLIGRRFPSSTGIAGWVLVTRQPLVIEDAATDPRFSREAARATGYVPRGIMAVPLLHDERTLGVLEVLDRPQQSRFTLAEADLLGLFAGQAAIALDLLGRARAAAAALDRSDLDARLLASVGSSLRRREGGDREAALQLLTSLEALLRAPRDG